MSITWSYSSLGLFQQCPRKYHRLRVVKDIVEPEAEHLTYGKLVHEAAEKYIRDGEPIPAKYSFLSPVLDVLKEIPGQKHCEHKMGLTEDLEACGFFDKKVWYRGIADLIIINDNLAHIIDYKTGKSAQYADTKQLELMALAVFKHFPTVEKVKAGLAFVVCEEFVKSNYDKEKSPEMWLRWVQETDKLAAAYENDVWNAKPNGLCGKYCDYTACPHNGRR